MKFNLLTNIFVLLVSFPFAFCEDQRKVFENPFLFVLVVFGIIVIYKYLSSKRKRRKKHDPS